jgi:hypothetical protein
VETERRHVENLSKRQVARMRHLSKTSIAVWTSCGRLAHDPGKWLSQ